MKIGCSPIDSPPRAEVSVELKFGTDGIYRGGKLDWILPLIGGLGLGSLLTSFVNHFLNKRSQIDSRLYQEKREAYLGLLEALHKAAVSPSDLNSKNFALWQTRVNLFGSMGVSKSVEGMIATNDGPRSERDKVFRTLVDEMRLDLSK